MPCVFLENGYKTRFFLKVKELGDGLLSRTLDGFFPGAILSHPVAARSQGQFCSTLEIQIDSGEAAAACSGLALPLLLYQEIPVLLQERKYLQQVLPASQGMPAGVEWAL